MSEKTYEQKKYIELFRLLDKEPNDDNVLDAIEARQPFKNILDQLSELRDRVNYLENKNSWLRENLEKHAHMNGKVYYEA